jgi:S1-C subfamily serine protease
MSEPFSQYPYGQEYRIPEPPRKHRGRQALGMTATAVIALAAGAGGGIALSNSSSSHSATTSSNSSLSASKIAAKVDPGLVDVISTLGFQNAEAEGTGIVLTSNGEILTNNHVINGATSIKVTDIGNGQSYKATVVGYDDSQDVAVIQLTGASGLKTATIGDSSTVAVGDSVVGLGNAGGVGGTPSVAPGQVTALNQSISPLDESTGVAEHLSGMIESNADIQPGDSGGALVNQFGAVVGMDTAAVTSGSPLGSGGEGSGGSGTGGEGSGGFGGFGGFGGSGNGEFGGTGSGQGTGGLGNGEFGGSGSSGFGGSGNGEFGGTGSGGFGDGGFGGAGSSSGTGSSGGTGSSSSSTDSTTQGYSIPINTAISIEKQIEAGQATSIIHIGATAFLGIESSSTSSASGSGQATTGAQIAGAVAGTPAATAGLTAGDTITAVAGHAVSSTTAIQQILVGYHPGNKISVTWTDTSGQSHTATVTLANGPAA